MSSHERVSNELWMEIFQFLPRDSLKHVYATDRKFATISLALLFSHLAFDAYHLDQPREYIALRGNGGLELELDRLRFWTSDKIAPFVRECTIAPRRQHALQLDCTDFPDILMTSLMDSLGKFTRLKKLSAHRVKLTQAGVTHLCRIPLLTETVFERSFIATASDDRNLWLTIVHRGHLRELEATGSVSAVSNTLAHSATFPNVHKLRLSMNFSTMAQNLVILAKFPVVCELQLDGWGEIESGPTEKPAVRASDVLPLLREYRGTCTPLHLFLPKPTLERLVIDFCPLEDLSFQLRGEYGHITALQATVHDLDRNNVSTIFRCLPALIELPVMVLAESEDGEYQDLNPRVCRLNCFSSIYLSGDGLLLPTGRYAGLPPTLQRLAISWRFHFDSDEDEDTLVVLPEMIPDFFAMRDKLGERCPALRTLWFDGHDFLFRWRQLLDREEVQQEESYEDIETEGLREELEDFWEGR
ncbi:hypothetical protein FB45DRAFT_1053399 [Roridomyces roridus]|uniref:F-box domain-containing protein n=1 Tax=Roridomyces roridus TaxID=1738132 RepID=A0AAD7FYK3_9AGAR|nr:hypothetical protein FB45DRAFT_1053399 [Roridomyces roridus]